MQRRRRGWMTDGPSVCCLDGRGKTGRRGGRHLQAVRQHAGAARRGSHPAAGPVPRPGGTQRRGQVDARLDPVRHLPAPMPGRCASMASRRPRSARSTLWRRRIATVFQHSMVVPGLTVAENVFLGHQPGPGGLVDWRRMREQAQQIMADWGFRLDVGRPCASLTVEQRQIVEIARALAARDPLPAARRADRGPGARRRGAPVRPRPAARQQRGGRPVHLAPPRGSVRDLPGRRGDPRR